ncbi:glycosyltransferase [Chitinophaga qingshengii]|uniref:Glycosyltransferase n=1 Tax=Chitinophaga qingshengii TaxID=1569794 RepID=A0ABR7TI78_9BACT|nr:glycosyltransferase [Chitinophaga qingshengii]MBC9928779.1 glycosyltransferase [Chitinophaga qingshengii]
MMSVYNRDIVIVGLQPWYTKIGSNCKSLAAEFSKHNRVLYVNAPIDRRTAFNRHAGEEIDHHKAVISGKAPSLVQISDNMWNLYPTSVIESINWLPFTSLFSAFNRVNNQRFARNIRKAIQQLDFKNVILFNDNDIFRSFYLKELLQPSVYIYYSRDNILAVDYWRRHGQTLEPKHIAKADIGVANSLYLTERLKKYNPESYYIGQGCNLELFNPMHVKATPADIAHLKGPVIGYVGALTSLRLDIPLLVNLASEQRDWNFVLVGHEDEDFKKSALHGLPNVHFTGGKPMAELPAYVHAFDVCINPQVVNDLTIGNYPLKVDEYLAMGKPVVATRTPTMKMFEEQVYLAEDLTSYLVQLKTALESNPAAHAANRRAFALTHTWENSAAALYEAIQTYEARL